SSSLFFTLSLHDALPISWIYESQDAGRRHARDGARRRRRAATWGVYRVFAGDSLGTFLSRFLAFWLANPRVCRSNCFILHASCRDRKSTRLNSSHVAISY